MDNARLFLIAALGLILMLLWQAWEEEQKKTAGTDLTATQTKPPAEPRLGVPQAPETQTAPPPRAAAAPRPADEGLARGARIAVETDVVRAVIDTQGGDLRELSLREYPVAADKPNEPFPFLRDSDAELYVAQSGLIGHGGNYANHKTRFAAVATGYALRDGQNDLRVPLTWNSPDGVRYTKTYLFHRGSYVIDIEITVENGARKEWSGYLYSQFQRSHVESGGLFNVIPSYTGGAIYTPEHKYEKIPFDEIAKKSLKREVTGGWVAMLQHYFVGSWMPRKDERNEFYSDAQDGRRILGYKNLDAVRIAPGQSAVLRTQLYAGAKEQRILKTLAEGMELTVDYGWLTVLSAPLFWLLAWIHGWVGNWGWAIILVTVLIKAAFYPLSAASYRSMAQMKKLQPKLQALKERYGDDRQKLNQAMMELYKTDKINPLGGCLPIIVQIPVFLALYWVLLESVEMRQAPWILWIKDLSAQDPYYVLPIVMGVTMYAQQFLNPQPVDPIQKKMFMLMPLFFMVFFLFFPAGLVLYWTVNNLLSVAQQWQITRAIAGKGKPA